MADHYKKGLVDPFLMLGEEGLECSLEVIKAQRFGLYGDPAWTNQPGNRPPRANIIQEAGDFLVIIEALIARGDITRKELDEAKHNKWAKLRKLYGDEAVLDWFYKREG